MATYNTIPNIEESADRLQEPKTSMKRVAGVAVAVFVLGVIAATAVTTAPGVSPKYQLGVYDDDDNDCLAIDGPYDGDPDDGPCGVGVRDDEIRDDGGWPPRTARTPSKSPRPTKKTPSPTYK